jgi:DmsE family decaheme c-type cytochrome
VLGLLSVCFVLAAPNRAQSPQFVGSEVCQACHTDIAQGFNRNPHFESIAKGNRPPAATGCEGCHGPGSAHIAGGGDVSAIIRFDELAPVAVLDRCLTCHADDLGKMRIRRSSHSTAEMSCVSCHSIHKSKEIGPLLAKRETELCYTCHRQVNAQFNLPFKHRVNEGSIQCSDCHNPHGAPEATWAAAGSRTMVNHAAGNDIACVGCHTDKRGPFVYEHAPVRVEGCATCHNAHGSTNARLLTRPAAFTMCLECHNGVAGFGTRGDGIPNPTVGFHNIANPQFQNCVTCHSRIHGSNADRLLRR